MNALRARRCLCAGIVAVCGIVGGAGLPARAQELGVGRGIDHVAHLVRLEDFEAVSEVFTEGLGFSATPPLLSPLGGKNRLIWFADRSYLELLTFTELNDFTAPFLAFLDQHEGAKFFGTEVVDGAQATAFLTGAGYPNVGPIPAAPLILTTTGDILGLSPLWGSIVLTAVVAPDNAEFFLDYDEGQVEQMFTDFPAVAPRPHANTAQRIDALWLVVSDLDAAIAFYEGLGLEVRGKHKKIHYLGARGAEVRFGAQTLALLQPDGPGITADFAADRGEGLLGVSVAVARLERARHLVNANTGLHLRTFKDRGRERFLIPASVTRGVLVEMVEE